MIRAQLVLLGSAAGVAMATAADVSALVQRDTKLHVGAASAESCECLGWQDAYSKHGAKCGDGHELDTVGIPGFIAREIPQIGYEFCAMFFQSLPNSKYCLNDKFSGTPAEWCYVSDACTEGAKSGGPLHTRNCTRGRDATLGEMKFEEFAAYVHENKLELGLTVQFAYPTWQKEKLPDVQAFWGLAAPEDAKPIDAELRARLQAQVDSGKTMFFTSRDGHPPYAVSEGAKLYYINFAEPGHIDFARKEDMNRWACVAGCGSANRPLW